MNDLTKNAEKLLVLIYKYYKFRIDNGKSLENAKFVGDLDHLHDNLHIKFSLEDTLELIRELSRAKYLNVTWADNTAYLIAIDDALIIYGENRVADTIKNWFEWADTITAPFKP